MIMSPKTVTLTAAYTRDRSQPDIFFGPPAGLASVFNIKETETDFWLIGSGVISLAGHGVDRDVHPTLGQGVVNDKFVYK